MSEDVEAVNKTLEILGSDMRVQAGDLVAWSIAEVLRCLPAYVDRKIQEALTERNF